MSPIRHSRSRSRSSSNTLGLSRQSLLNPDDFKNTEVAKWTRDGMLDHIVELIIEDDMVSHLFSCLLLC